MLRSKVVTLLSDGAGAASATVGMPTCQLVAVQTDDVDGVTDAAVLTLASQGRNLLNKTAAGVDAVYGIGVDTIDAAGAAMADWSMHPVVHGSMVVSATGMGAAKTLKVTLFYR